MAPYISLMKQATSQRNHPSKELFNALRWIVYTGIPGRLIPYDSTPWAAAHQQVQRWIKSKSPAGDPLPLRAVLG